MYSIPNKNNCSTLFTLAGNRWKNVLSFAVVISALTGCVGPSSVSPPLSLFDTPSNTFSEKRSVSSDSKVKQLDAYVGYVSAIKEASNALGDNNKQRIALGEGMAIIEYRCGEYFDLLGQAVQKISFQRKETSLLGGLAQGSMGLANQSAKSIANTASLFGFTT
jgi:hypothetical protein